MRPEDAKKAVESESFNSRTREDATVYVAPVPMIRCFNSRTREDATTPHRIMNLAFAVSIHAPVRMRLAARVHHKRQSGFNSRTREDATV